MSRKKQNLQNDKDIRSDLQKNDNLGNSSFTTTESTQLGGATGSQPGGATGSQPGGATGSQPGGDTGSQSGGATGSRILTRSHSRVKEENDGGSTGGHLHSFVMKFSRTDRYEYTIDCNQPCTVLEAIKSSEHFHEKCLDENIIIQLGIEDRKSIVATHFPCSCIGDGKTVIISCESGKVEDAQNQQHKIIHSRDKYSVFYIDTVGGLHTRSKELFRNNAVKQFTYLCVYGEKGMTVEEALKRDGRFIDGLCNFNLSDKNDDKRITGCKEMVDNLDRKRFKIRLPRNTRANDETLKKNQGESNNSQNMCDGKRVADVVRQSGISVRTALEESSSDDKTEKIYRLLREQFPGLKEWMENRFPGDSYEEALNLRKEDFGKIQQSFSEVHRVRKLLKLGESVCKVVVENVCQGTGFVLFDNFILTNAHIFKDCAEGDKLKEGINVFVLFNYEDPEPHTNYSSFQVAWSYIHYREHELDYAILELNPEGKAIQTANTKKTKVPPGLLKKFGPMPSSGEACIIGHPAGEVKKMDPTCIIEKEKRGQAVNDHFNQCKDTLFTLCSIIDLIKKQGIENIMMGGNRAENVGTYNTFMYHGSSGSPVFDAHCRVFGLHTAGYVYEFKNPKDSVIEFAQPVLTIFEHFVSVLKERGYEELLKRVEEESKGNSDLKKKLNLTTVNPDEEMETD